MIYREEFGALNGIRVVQTLTREQPAGWDGYARRVDEPTRIRTERFGPTGG